MNILITGIAGFIGFHLAHFLSRRGDRVIGCDNFNPYYHPQLKRHRAERLEEQGVKVLEIDIRDSSQLKDIIQKEKITHLVHLAAQAGVRYAAKNPHAYVESNLDGFLHILELIRFFPHIPLIYASSSSVYGLNQKIPFAESDPTDMPSNLYGATKKSNELMAYAYHHMFGISTVGLRFFTVYGPWGRPDMAYFSFTDAIMQSKPLQIYNQGQMKRDFTYIDDIIQGVVAALDKVRGYDIFNLGNHQPESVLTLVHLLEEKLGRKAMIEWAAASAGEVEITYADIAKSQGQLQFQPAVSLSEGLDHFIKWYQDDYLNL
jgi:UDP-glucuronate 4-epimerase